METPFVSIDLKTVANNIARTQAHFDGLGMALRPHIKTHKIPALARQQIDAGARGITCQKIGEAQVMRDGGIDDILITYNILGEHKLARLRRLAARCVLSVVADNETVVEGLSAAFSEADKPLTVLVECDTGFGRCGVQSPAAALVLAKRIAAMPGLNFGGLMTYPPKDDQGPVEAYLSAAKRLLTQAGLPCPVVSSGGTPNMKRAGEVPSADEHRAGSYIYFDRSQIAMGACGIDDCALSVEATVVSRPTQTRAIIDAGSKSLTSDLSPVEGYGLIKQAPDAVIAGLSEEHGTIDLTASAWRPQVGERISIIPNHACVISNLVDEVTFVEANGGTRQVEVLARGKSV
jgi:D-serine deaminase-like pyridoxal phosphate-dependent protein